eukprot:g63379.t1
MSCYGLLTPKRFQSFRMGASGSQFNKETFEAELRTAIKRCERMIQKAEARAPFARQECQKYLGAGKEDLARSAF